LIDTLRQRIFKYFPEGLYDPQDLEHQVLFRLTTFDPVEITENIIQNVVREQFLIIQNRLEAIKKYDLEYIFRGLTGKYKDLNQNNRLLLHKLSNNKFVASGLHMNFEVEIKQIDDQNIIELFTRDLHYMHAPRNKGQAFGLFFKGDSIPFAIETTEPSIFVKDYKREALLAHGIDPNKAVEITRLYCLPGSPKNSISVLDGFMAKYFQSKGMQAMFTTTMPMYSKTKGSTVSGGMINILLVKDLRHFFVEENIKDQVVYRHVTGNFEECNSKVICTHPRFPVLYVVEVYKLLGTPFIDPLPVLKDKQKVIYVPLSKRYSRKENELEVKFKIDKVDMLFQKLSEVSVYIETKYIRDVIWGYKDDNSPNRKYRFRTEIKGNVKIYELTSKYKIDYQENSKMLMSVEEIFYKGDSYKIACETLQSLGNLKEENSYEKVRFVFKINEVEVDVDIYPFGVILEIEGSEDRIQNIVKLLDLDINDAIKQNADEVFLDWARKWKLPEFWEIRYGLSGDK
jgi:hypothetical protein